MLYSTPRRLRHRQPSPTLPWQAAALIRRFRCTPAQALVFLAQTEARG